MLGEDLRGSELINIVTNIERDETVHVPVSDELALQEQGVRARNRSLPSNLMPAASHSACALISTLDKPYERQAGHEAIRYRIARLSANQHWQSSAVPSQHLADSAITVSATCLYFMRRCLRNDDTRMAKSKAQRLRCRARRAAHFVHCLTEWDRCLRTDVSSSTHLNLGDHGQRIPRGLYRRYIRKLVHTIC